MSGLRQTAVTVVVVVCALVSVAAAMVAWNASRQAVGPMTLTRLNRGDVCIASFEGERSKGWGVMQGKAMVVASDPAKLNFENEEFTKGVPVSSGDHWVSVTPSDTLWLGEIPILRSELAPVPLVSR